VSGSTWARLLGFGLADATLLSRGATLAGAYLATLAVVLASFQVLATTIATDSAQAVLSYYLICGIVSGIDPGSAKASLIERSGGTAPDLRGMTAATTVKAIAMAPVFAGIWLYSSTEALGLRDILIWTPLLTIVGFVTTNYRNLLDFEGRYAAAIWLKQGSLSIAIAGVVLMVAADAPLFAALLLTTASRVLWLACFSRFLPKATGRTEHASPKQQIGAWLTIRGWMPIMALSVLASLGGSIDRMVALRYLTDDAAADYFVVFELLSKFWLFSYILAPILFATRVRGGDSRILQQTLAFMVLVGVLFIAATWIVFSSWFTGLIGWRLGFEGHNAAIIAGAFALAAVSQLLTADLQVRGKSRSLVLASLVLLPLTYVAFAELTYRFGLGGLSLAWLFRTATELTFLIIMSWWARWK
jgi:O-antigen/teichoic acid export membrane protein